MRTFRIKADKFHITLLLIFFTAQSLLSAQQALRSLNLAEQTPSWQTVPGGKIIAPAAETSYGFTVLTDGRMLTACTENGDILFQKTTDGKPSEFLSSKDDFLCTITSGSNLNFINPSGFTLWTKKIPEPVQTPVHGTDGRIFIVSRSGVSCFGTDGKQKWNIETGETKNMPLCILPDQTYILFLNEEKNGKTCGIRFTIFGEIKEEITFAGRIMNAHSCPYGILLVFDDGAYGLCTVQNENTISLWSRKAAQNDGHTRTSETDISGTYSALYTQKDSTTDVTIIENKSGKINGTFSIGKINLSDIKYKKATENGFFITDSSRAVEFNENGTILWKAELPPAESWTDLIYTESSSGSRLIIFMNNWLINCYFMNQTPQNSRDGRQKSYRTSQTEQQSGAYNMSSPAELETICRKYRQGNYGKDESQMYSVVKNGIQSYAASLSVLNTIKRENRSYYEQNPVYTQRLLEAASMTGTDSFSEDFARLLMLETDPEMLKMIISCAGKNGYDTEGDILSAFEDIVLNRMEKKDSATAQAICTATYEIVRFMGRPSFYNKGKTVIVNFLYPQYGKEAAAIARETLENILKLQL